MNISKVTKWVFRLIGLALIALCLLWMSPFHAYGQPPRVVIKDQSGRITHTVVERNDGAQVVKDFNGRVEHIVREHLGGRTVMTDASGRVEASWNDKETKTEEQAQEDEPLEGERTNQTIQK